MKSSAVFHYYSSVVCLLYERQRRLRSCCQLQVSAVRVSHVLDAETCEFSQVLPLSVGH